MSLEFLIEKLEEWRLDDEEVRWWILKSPTYSKFDWTAECYEYMHIATDKTPEGALIKLLNNLGRPVELPIPGMDSKLLSAAKNLSQQVENLLIAELENDVPTRITTTRWALDKLYRVIAESKT
jgi:hypothetical protein